MGIIDYIIILPALVLTIFTIIMAIRLNRVHAVPLNRTTKRACLIDYNKKSVDVSPDNEVKGIVERKDYFKKKQSLYFSHILQRQPYGQTNISDTVLNLTLIRERNMFVENLFNLVTQIKIGTMDFIEKSVVKYMIGDYSLNLDDILLRKYKLYIFRSYEDIMHNNMTDLMSFYHLFNCEMEKYYAFPRFENYNSPYEFIIANDEKSDSICDCVKVNTLFNAKCYDEAIVALNRALLIKKNSHLLMLRSECYMKKGMFEKARIDFELALKIEKSNHSDIKYVH